MFHRVCSCGGGVSLVPGPFRGEELSRNRSLPEGVPNSFQTLDLWGGYVPGYKGPGIQRDTIGKHMVRTLLECFLVQTDFAWVVTDLA